jgi:quercetin dioxygenase-like cupin family protein
MLRGAIALSVTLVTVAPSAQAPAAPPAPAAAPQPATPEPPTLPINHEVIVPVYHEPHHRQVFQNGPMRILDLQIPPGDMSWFHSHESPVLYVTLSTSATRTQNLGSEWSGGGARAGARPGGPAREGRGAPQGPAPAPGGGRGSTAPRATSTTSYAQQPVTHRLENVGDRLFRAMVVINETAGDETITSQAAGFEGTPELTNRWFRAYRLTLAPGQKSSAHKHQAAVAIIQATSGKGVGAGPMTFEFNEPGQWAFFDVGAAHEVRNTGDGPIELIEVELRRK